MDIKKIEIARDQAIRAHVKAKAKVYECTVRAEIANLELKEAESQLEYLHREEVRLKHESDKKED